MKVWKRNAVVAASVLFVCVAVYLIVDLLYAAVDPNIRLGGEEA